ncbi:MAG TPA: hypothetical protein PKG81_05140, partial [Candidatus Omnitrophota bacterium]|nr:hypothetical protein [Candidatus Omnitrophota bacterium]
HSGGSIFTDPFDDLCVINGVANDGATVYEYATRITFPTFNLEEYKRLAQESGDYYSSSQTFTNKTFTPTSGIVYIDGDATFKGVCTINGGIIANNILVINTLEQNVSGTRNVIMATTGNIKIFGRLYTEKALVYAAQDILSVQALAIIDINGIMLAGRNIDMWDLITFITYDYVFVAPSDMLDENGEQPFGLVSWNS